MIRYQQQQGQKPPWAQAIASLLGHGIRHLVMHLLDFRTIEQQACFVRRHHNITRRCCGSGDGQ